MIRLHWHPFSIVPRRVRILLREKGIPHETSTRVADLLPRAPQRT
jgi:glutathione S-transferase